MSETLSIKTTVLHDNVPLSIKIRSDDKISIVGYSGAGKTLLLEYFINNVVNQFPNLVVVDPVSRFSQKTNIRFRGKVECLHPSPNKICMKLQSEEDLEEVCKTINDIDTEPAFLIVDEIDRFVDVHSMLSETSMFFQQGRNYQHGGMFTVRQVGKLNKEVFSNSHYLILFKVYNKSDIEYLTDVLPLKFVRMIPQLSEHSFFLIDLRMSKLLGEYIYLPEKDTLKLVKTWEEENGK